MSQTNSRFLFVVAPEETGSREHLSRCLVLAKTLADYGGTCSIIATPQSAFLLGSRAPFLSCATTEDTTPQDFREAAGRLHYDAVVIDHPGLSQDDHIDIAGDRPSIVLDDHADRVIGGRIVVNPSLICAADTYQGLMVDEAELLSGPSFALVSPQARNAEGAPQIDRGTMSHVLLSLQGLTSTDLVMRIVDSLRPKLGEAVLDILLPKHFETLRSLTKIASRDTRMVLHGQPEAWPSVVLRADIAISAVGAGFWELCARGLPIVAVSVSPSDHATTAHLTDLEAAVVLEASDQGFEDRLERTLVRLVADPNLRRKLSSNSAALIDGSGADRIAQKLIGLLPR